MVFPPRNLPGDAEKWGRAIEEALGNIDKTARIASQMSDNTTKAVDGVISAGSDTKLELNYEVQRNEETREKLAEAEELIENTRGELEDARESFDGRMDGLDEALDRARANLASTFGANLIPNGAGEWGTEGGWYDPGDPNLGAPVEWVEGDAPAGLPGRFVSTGTAISYLFDLGVTVEPGGEYLFELWVRGTGAGVAFGPAANSSGVPAGTAHHIPGLEPSAADGGGTAALIMPLPGEWTRYGVRYVMGESTTSLHLTANLAGPVEVAGMRLTRMIGGEDIQAGSVAAQVGMFIDAMMENLTVTGVAHIDVTVTNELYAKMAVVEKLQALEGIITTDMVATGAVTATKVTASEELTAKIAQFLTVYAEDINVGRDARWWSGGLVFYAPPAQGQDPTDWENRTPLIALTPTGDLSITVAQDGEPTAGMTAEGEVWAHVISADQFIVAGEPLDDILQRGPRGILGIASAANFISVNTALSPYLSLNFTPEVGRMYEIEFAVRGGAQTSSDERLRQYIKQARPGQSSTHGTYSRELGSWENFISSPANKNFSYRNAVIVAGDDLIGSNFTNSEGVTTIWAQLQSRVGSIGINSGGGANRAMPPHLTIKDIGEARPISVQTVSASSPPPPSETWYGPSTISSGAAWGVRPDGSNAIDGRLTLGGYNIYGSDMAENILYPFNFSRLNGSTVRAATVNITATQNAPVAYHVYAGTGPTTGHVHLFTTNHASNGSRSQELSPSARQALVGKTCLILKPAYPGNTASYGYFASTANVAVIYSK